MISQACAYGNVVVCLGVLLAVPVSKYSIRIAAGLCVILFVFDAVINFEINSGELILLLIFAVLPLLNAIFDWPSWATSRYLLRQLASEEITPRRLLIHTLLDFGIAVFLIFVMALCWTAIVSLLPIGISTRDAIQVASEDPWGRGLWLSLMLGSTLLPTLLHMGTVLVSFGMANTKHRARYEMCIRDSIAGARLH